MNKLLYLLPLPFCLFSQDARAPERLPAEPAVEFTSTSNASQVGTNYVVGYQFTVLAPVVLTSLGAVLQGNTSRSIFGALPASMPVGLWDGSQNLLVSATVLSSDPLLGHFNYKRVAGTQLLPGVSYTVAGLVPAGWSALSNVPAMVPGSLIAYGGARSLASKTLAFPPRGGIAGRNNFFGASFTYTGGANPVAIPGRDRNIQTGAAVTLDGSASFSPAGGSVAWKWALISVPRGSTAVLSEAATVAPSFVPDREGIYVAQLIVADGSRHSKPLTVSITAASLNTLASAGGVR